MLPQNPGKDRKKKHIHVLSYLGIDGSKAIHYLLSNGSIVEEREGEFPAEWFDDPDHAPDSYEHYRNLWNNDHRQTDGAIFLPSLSNNNLTSPADIDDLTFSTDNDDLTFSTDDENLTLPTDNDNLTLPTDNDNLTFSTDNDNLTLSTDNDNLTFSADDDNYLIS